MKKAVVVLIILAILVGVGTSVFYFVSIRKSPAPPGIPSGRQQSEQQPAVNPPPNLNYLGARVDSIDGNTISVTQTTPTGPKNYKITVGSDTQISLPVLSKPFVMTKGIPETPPAGSVEDIKTGQFISIATSGDLNSDSLKASSISLPPLMNVIAGKINEIGNDLLKINSFKLIDPAETVASGAAPGQKPEEIEYTVKLTADTLVYKNSISPASPEPKVENITVKDLKKGTQVIVYASADIRSKEQITAMYVEVLPTSVTTPEAAPES